MSNRSKNFIPLLEVDGDGLSSQDAISNAFSTFYRSLMGTTTSFYDIGVNWEQYYPVESHPPFHDIEEPFTEEEIRGVFSLGVDKTPGPDGFNLRFYQHFWSIL